MNDAKRAVHYLLAAATAAYLVSGLGISNYRTMEQLTGGILTKALSFQLHQALLIPFVLLLALHVWLTLASGKGKEKGNNKENKR